ncbi:MAG: type II toxin-antitoxin system HipA family toxin [Sphaerochaetaceae bacterium]|nr:type II toxin-antitoxin system HipA family toxin [Sphaerochaetaceae bacterium]
MKLDVYLTNRKCGELYSTPNKGIVFEYNKEYVQDVNSIPLSQSLPLWKTCYSEKECIPYFIGLLPEGSIKTRISKDLHLRESNTIGLLEVLGGECAGTVSLYKPDEEHCLPKSEYVFSKENYEAIDDLTIAEKIKSMSISPLLRLDKSYRLSLAGAQEKLSLANFDSKWYIPKNGAPSTHIIKPSRTDYSSICVNEYLVMKIAKLLFKDTPEVELLTFCTDDFVCDVYCVKRFDRTIEKRQEGLVIKRVHQEDMCQALGIMSDRKYQNDGGPSMKNIIGLLREKSFKPIEDIESISKMFIFQYLIGNCDAHGKNYSLLNNGSLSLAPLYDAVSTVVYPDLTRKMAMKVGNHYEIDRITRNHFIDALSSCSINKKATINMFDFFESKIKEIELLLQSDSIAIKNEDLSIQILNHYKKTLLN